MKKRNGFVSNSSSSSFVCGICGEIESGMDLCLSEAEMYECDICHHDFHNDCARPILPPDVWNEYRESGASCYGVPEKYCPICLNLFIPDSRVLGYLIEASGKTKEDIIKEIQDENKNRICK